jgi:hypothetical protein
LQQGAQTRLSLVFSKIARFLRTQHPRKPTLRSAGRA